jgi:hypothetical protein
MHRDKISRMGSSIDTRSPMPQPHLTLYGRDYVAKKRATTEAAFSDLKMIQSIAKTMTRQPSIPERKGPVSLNADARKSEIFRIMKENHRLLDRLETLEPMVSTANMERDFKEKQRYTILVSHSKRLAGEYDAEVTRIRTEDKAKTDAMNRSVHLRLTKHKMENGNNSMSMPSLTPLANTDPAGLAGVRASPAPKRLGKPVVTRPLGSPGGLPATQPSSSSKSVPPAGYTPDAVPAAAPPAAAAETELSKRDSRVSFSSQAEQKSEEQRSEWERQGGPTPHPKKIDPDTYFQETPKSQEDAVQETPTAAEEIPVASTPAADTAPAQEFDPVQAQPDEQKVGVGLAGSPAPDNAAGKAADAAEDSYQDDFADASQTDMSKALDDSKAMDESGTFENSQS